MTPLAVIADSSGLVSYQVFSGAIAVVATMFISAIGMLWRRIDRDAQKCLEDRSNDQKDRAAENKAWSDRVEALYRERANESQKMLDQIVKMTEKTEETKYATIAAITDSSKSMVRIEKALGDLTQLLHERRP